LDCSRLLQLSGPQPAWIFFLYGGKYESWAAGCLHQSGSRRPQSKGRLDSVYRSTQFAQYSKSNCGFPVITQSTTKWWIMSLMNNPIPIASK
jgi:hypothetical protein